MTTKNKRHSSVPIAPTVAGAERWWVDKARDDPYFFIWYVTGFQPAKHHKIWLSRMFHPDKRRINIVAPRESAKSTIAVYALAWLMAKYPLLTFGIIAVSATVAKDRLSMLRALFAENARFRNVFPWIKIDTRKPDTQDEFSILSDYDNMPYTIWKTMITTKHSELVKNPSIFASGNGGKGIIGRRISGVLLMDDMVDDSFLSDELQTKMMKYISSVLEPCVTTMGRIWNIGTRWMVDDIYEKLMKNPAWESIMIPAIIEDDTGKQHSYWPEYWPLDILDNKRIAMDDDLLFRIMYLCDPTAITAALFARHVIDRDIPELHPPFVDVYVTIDTATSMRTYGDWNVIYIAGVDKERNVYLMDGIRFKDETEETVEKIIQMCDAAFTIYDKLTACLIEHVNAEGTFISLLNSRRPDIPVKGVRPKGDKMQRAKQVSYWGIKNKLYINQQLPFIANLKSEWQNFPVHKHDDTLDPVSQLFQELQFGRVQAQLLTVNIRAIRMQRRQQKEQRRHYP